MISRSSSSSSSILWLEDDDCHDNDNAIRDPFVEKSMLLTNSSTLHDTNAMYKKRKLTNGNIQINPSLENWSKRQKNNHNYLQTPSKNFHEFDSDIEPVFIDPNEYVLEEPDPPQFCSFDWTKQKVQSQAPPRPPTPPLLTRHQLLIQNKASSSTIQKVSKPAISSPLRKQNIVLRPIDTSDVISFSNSNTNSQLPQKKKKPIAIPVQKSSQKTIAPKSPETSTRLLRSNSQRSAPTTNSHVSQTKTMPSVPASPISRQPERSKVSQPQKPVQSSLPTATRTNVISPSTPTSLNNNTTPPMRRPILNGTGFFSAFHDTKYYHCNICKFKSVTSSTLLQHLFTHMFFCDQCSFYTYSHISLSQHMFEKHTENTREQPPDTVNPKSYNLLYITRCSDGTFALCMDSSSKSSAKTNNNDEDCVVSSTAQNEQRQNTRSSHKSTSEKDLVNDDDSELLMPPEKSYLDYQTLVNFKIKGKQDRTYVLMKHRKFYLMKKTHRLHSLTLEHNICREHSIRKICHTDHIPKRRKSFKTMVNYIVADCLRTIVNWVVDNENSSDQQSSHCTLSKDLPSSVLSIDNLDVLMKAFKLIKKNDQFQEQEKLYQKERAFREDCKHVFILSSTERNQTDQSIISSLQSSLTYGDSIFTQTKLNKLPPGCDNTYRFLKPNLGDVELQLNPNTARLQKKFNSNRLASSGSASLRSVLPKPACSLPNHSKSSTMIDRNNNSVTPAKSKISSVIILD